MALTNLQRRICLLLAEQRKQSGESYVAGGAALAATWATDRATLAGAGLQVTVVREGPAFVQAEVRDGATTEILQWAQDSAFRFFPLVEDETFGLTLHPVDHATNKVLALAGRRVARDWVDAIRCHDTVQPLGYLAWAASGKDPGLSPSFILEQAARTRYVQAEIDRLAFEGPAPRAAELSARWHDALEQARELVRALPAEHAGKCVLDDRGRLLTSPPDVLRADLAAGRVSFHEGRIRGAFPELRSP